jgi:hypothetical protein
MSLPIVSADTFYSKLASVLGDRMGVGVGIYRSLVDENPVLADLLRYVLDNEEYSEDFKEGYCKAVAHIYGLLASQDEADEFDRQWSV